MPRSALVLTACLAGVALFAPAAHAQISPWTNNDTWPDFDDIGPTLEMWADQYPDIAEVEILGYSVANRPIWAIHITDNVGVDEDEPEFKYIATMHGDEVVGTKMTMNLAYLLLSNYYSGSADPDLVEIVDEIDLWLVPLMNPDGYDRGSRTRYNNNGVDLNRDFPNLGESNDPGAGYQPETATIMAWSAQHSFVCSANFHGGAAVVNYPYDNTDTGSQYTPDDDLFQYISYEYARTNSHLLNGGFTNGITNGVDWYTTHGCMQDWNLHFHGCNETTIEISQTKEPSENPGTQTYWNWNRDSMLNYMRTCLIGVRGIVTDAGTGLPIAATVRIVGRDYDTYTDPDVGDYHRMIMPGTYDLEFTADGYDPLTITGVVVNSGDATRLDVQMAGGPQMVSPNGGETLVAGINTTVQWSGNPAIQFQVQYTDNYGDISQTTDGFERTSLGADYTTGGSGNWVTATSDSHTGARSASHSDISNNQNVWMQRTVQGPGTFSFWYRVSSEDDYDYLDAYIDGTRVVHESGESGWQQYSTTLTAGSHTVRWEYDKDVSLSEGSDTAWVDDITMLDDNTVWQDVVNLSGTGITFASWTPPAPGTDYKVRVRGSYGPGVWGDWDESDGTFEVIQGVVCPWDTAPGDGDGTVGVDDFFALLQHWGACPTPPATCPWDNHPDNGDGTFGDGVVGVDDFFSLLQHWGDC
jgi:hypothetical protein